MGREIRRRKSTFIIIIVAFLLLAGGRLQPAFGQLSAGDIAFTGFNGDGAASNDGFAVVFLKDYTGGSKIHFSSKEWDGSSFAGSGGDFSWDPPNGGVTAGTVLLFENVEDSPSVKKGSVTDDANMNLSGSGDVIYAYTSTVDKNEGDYTFLAAIATNSDIYTNDVANPESEGTLEGTGLTKEGNETLLLPGNIDNAEYVGDRSGNTPNGYLTLLNDIRDDNWDIYNGNDIAPFPLFNDQSFTIVPPPTLSFTAANADFSEGSGTVKLTVKLVEANGTAVNADVVFLDASSSADASDIDGYFSKPVSFGTSASSGDTKTVSVNLNDDDNSEGNEKAVFKLQSISSGTIISPRATTLNIIDNDVPNIVINEIRYDTDGSNEVNTYDDEFIEFVNNGSSAIDISGWTVSDADKSRHQFPSGTVIPASSALVLFGNDEVNSEGGFGGAVVQSSNKTSSLSLNNKGDTITLKDSDGNVVVSESYNGNESGESITRDPDLEDSFTGHKSADTDDNSPFSPGTKIDGTAFGSATYATGIRGSEGWRLISSPTKTTSFADLFGKLWTEGIPGADATGGAVSSNVKIMGWDETSPQFTSPSTMSDNLMAGKGYAVYVYEDNDVRSSETKGGFPKKINSNSVDGNDNSEHSSPVEVQITATDSDNSTSIDGANEGWNLLGNPYGIDLSVTKLISALEAADASASSSIQIWDHQAGGGQGAYKDRTGGDQIAPFQAFWVRYNSIISAGDNIEVTLNRSKLAANTRTEFFKESNKTKFEISVSLHGQQFYDPFHISFSNKGKVKLDRYDSHKIYSLNPDAINLYGVEGGSKLLKDMLPENLDKKVEIPLGFDANNRKKLRFKWDGLRELPPSWHIKLIDRKLNQNVDLTKISEYSFTAKTKLDNSSKINDEPLYQKTRNENNDVRFLLSINPGTIQNKDEEQLPNSVKLNPNYPNPFNSSTTLSYELKDESDITLTIWNMIGQKVTTLVDDTKDAGTYKKTWNASQMPSGIYIARFEVEGKVYTRKMTLIK